MADPLCLVRGEIGCGAGGEPDCRFCGFAHFAPCPTPPLPPLPAHPSPVRTPPARPPAAPEVLCSPICQPGSEVWQRDANGHSCGARIEWVRANLRGGVSLADACASVAAEEVACSACYVRRPAAVPPPPPPLASSRCHVPFGSEALIGPGVFTCDVLQIDGYARVQNDTRVHARRVSVGASGILEVGTAERPAERVVFYLDHEACDLEPPSSLGACEASGMLLSHGTVRLHGVPKQPWSLLTADCDACAVFQVEECNGWTEGDRVVIAATGHRASTYAELISATDVEAGYWAERRTITHVGAACTLSLDRPLSYLHRGSWLDGVVPTQAEVANLDRSILITGPPIAWKDPQRPVRGGRGLVTAQADRGSMRVEWARVERCGRIAVGQYCAAL